MTAHGLIADIFSRQQTNVESDKRYITAAQFELLTKLIAESEDSGAVKRGMNGGFVWSPRGRWKYVLSQNPDGTRRALMRLRAGPVEESGRLF